MNTSKKATTVEIWGGLECTINRVGDAYFDQLQYGNLYEKPRWESIAGLGVKKLRFPVLWEKHQPSRKDPIDWSWTSRQLEYLKSNGIEVIAGLVHHGSGPAYTNLLDENFPELLAAYAREVATRFPWISDYTPVNEPLTTARFSGLYGFWYPHHKTDYSFLVALLNQLKGVVLSMQEIRKINPQARLVQTEDLGKTYSTPPLAYQAEFENERRWLSYDILCGCFTKEHKLWNYFRKAGITEAQLNFFIENKCPPDLLGFNHYVTSERYLDHNLSNYPPHTHGGNGKETYADVEAVRVDLKEPHGIKVLLQEAWSRFGRPIAITEVHLHCHREEQIRWFRHVHGAATTLAAEGVPIKAITAWAIFGSYGWNKLLTQPGGDYEPGVFDMRGGACRPTALSDYIKGLTSEKGFDHSFYANGKGWWQRSSRFLHGAEVENMQIKEPGRRAPRPLLIIGKRGTLGQAFGRLCDSRAIPYILAGREECDIATITSIEAALDLYKPWAVINAAGYVRVDDAEKEGPQCMRENSMGPQNLAIACRKRGIGWLTYSTDLVFDGAKKAPYLESDEVNPLNVYGRSKAQSEIEVTSLDPSALIIRTSAFFGPWDSYNFLYWAENNLAAGIPFSVMADVHISPTYVPDLVHASLDLLIDREAGIWHLANNGACTWAQLAEEVARRGHYNPSLIQAVPVDELNLPARRPKYSVLSSERAVILPSLENAIDRYFVERMVLAQHPINQ